MLSLFNEVADISDNLQHYLWVVICNKNINN